MIKVYFANVNDHFTKLIESYSSSIPNEVIRRANTFFFEADAMAFLIGRILLLKSLKDWGIDQPLETMRYSPLKKPYFFGSFNFNISHSGKWVICASALNNELGIDIEQGVEIDLNDLKSVFSDNEWHTIRSNSNPLAKFYEYWTIKEAVSKADGRGFHMDFKKIDLGQQATVSKVDKWKIKKLTVHDDVFCHVAFESQCIDFKIMEMTSTGQVIVCQERAS